MYNAKFSLTASIMHEENALYNVRLQHSRTRISAIVAGRVLLVGARTKHNDSWLVHILFVIFKDYVSESERETLLEAREKL